MNRLMPARARNSRPRNGLDMSCVITNAKTVFGVTGNSLSIFALMALAELKLPSPSSIDIK